MSSNDEGQHKVENEIACPSCHSHFFLTKTGDKQRPLYCTFCGAALQGNSDVEGKKSYPALSQASDVALVEEVVPQEQVQFSIGPYQVIQSIGKGGMGEVFLAYDTICGRKIALKRIRTDLLEHVQLFLRFLKEARITSQLTHPSIIPIYAIHEEENKLIYYTMPYVEGETLKEILRRTRQQEKKGENLNHIGGSIPALIRILINICQAVAYAHSKGVLHRDLKPENIIVGKFGEVLILDWGLAKVIKDDREKESEHDISPPNEKRKGLTHYGKVVGTVAYMAPERGMGNPATPQTDIYALGVILYQMLTLYMPFQRTTIPEFRKTMHLEQFFDPAEVAPYRDVPKMLTRICQQTLSPSPQERYQTVEHLIRDLESFIEGRSEWFQAASLDIHKKDDWEFQENVLIAEHVAITRHAEVSDWVSLMISKMSFSENMKIEAKVRIGERGHGLGFLLSIPEAAERRHLNDGYCLWLSSDLYKATKLLRSTVEVLNAPDVFLQRFETYKIRIEKIDNNIHFFLNESLQFSYISHLPIMGTHMGILSRDADFEIKDLMIFFGSQNVMVNCLAVPDAFLAHKDYLKALSEYRRIGYSFPGRAEGREAMFRAGVTLLEYARNNSDAQQAKDYYELALLEFEKLHHTPGAPLEYLGKALVYQSLHDYEEEYKCYVLACRRHHHHPLLHVLQEQIIYRMHESSRQHRLATYNLILLVVRHLPAVATTNHSQKLFASLQKHWELLYFIEDDPACTSSTTLKNIFFSIQLSFWLAKPYFLAELMDELATMRELYPICIGNALFCLIELGSWKLAAKKMRDFSKAKLEENTELQKTFETLRILLLCYERSLSEAVDFFFVTPKNSLTHSEMRVLLHLMEYALTTHQIAVVQIIVTYTDKMSLHAEEKLRIDCYRIWALLLNRDWENAGKWLHLYPIDLLSKETTPLHFLYGCWLLATEGAEIAHIHFLGILEVSYPRSWTLATHFLNGKIGKDLKWFQKAFLWEKRQLYRELILYYHCIGEKTKVSEYQNLEKIEYIVADDE